MGNCPSGSPSLLTSDWIWHSLVFLDEQDLATVSRLNSDLPAQCDQALLKLFLAQLNLEARVLSKRLSADIHIIRRLCPPDLDLCRPRRNGKGVQQLLTRLGNRAQVGDRLVISGMLLWIEHGDSGTRGAAIRAISKVAQRGDPRVTRAVLGRLRDPVLRGSAMEAAVEALQHVAICDDADIVSHIVAMLEERAVKTRYAALWALPSVVCKGDMRAIDIVLARADDEDEDIREIAIKSLGKLVNESHEKAITRIIGGLQDKSGHVRKAAMESLTLCRVAIVGA